MRCRYRLFVAADVDGATRGTGRLRYEQLEQIVRVGEGRGLGLSAGRLPEAQLKALWKALDDKASGFITLSSFGRFMRFGSAGAAAAAAGVASLSISEAGPTVRRSQRLAQAKEAKAKAVERETAHRLAHAARQKELAARQALDEARRLEEELAALSGGV